MRADVVMNAQSRPTCWGQDRIGRARQGGGTRAERMKVRTEEHNVKRQAAVRADGSKKSRGGRVRGVRSRKGRAGGLKSGRAREARQRGGRQTCRVRECAAGRRGGVKEGRGKAEGWRWVTAGGREVALGSGDGRLGGGCQRERLDRPGGRRQTGPNKRVASCADGHADGPSRVRVGWRVEGGCPRSPRMSQCVYAVGRNVGKGGRGSGQDCCVDFPGFDLNGFLPEKWLWTVKNRGFNIVMKIGIPNGSFKPAHLRRPVDEFFSPPTRTSDRVWTFQLLTQNSARHIHFCSGYNFSLEAVRRVGHGDGFIRFILAHPYLPTTWSSAVTDRTTADLSMPKYMTASARL
ncbi:hypothetical protein B0H13DRAFT_2479131 [Mycena leptocephala]|nr:hypothetical protein B0H13DRAFT_2479131 [Mycena leptocephala]